MQRSFALTLVVLLAGAVAAQASPITFAGSSGTLAASAVFENVGGNLKITLTNTSTADVTDPAQVLTALFFDLAGAVTLTPLSADITPGSALINFFATDPSTTGVGGEWAYKAGLSGAPGGATRGVSSTGLSWFGPGDRFPGANLQGPTSPDGVQYGITSAGDNPATGNGGISGNGLIKDSVVFVLGGLPAGFDPHASIGNVTFLYGTALGEGEFSPPSPPEIPEPATMFLVGAGLLGAAARVRRRT
jgi:hypothetical protein